MPIIERACPHCKAVFRVESAGSPQWQTCPACGAPAGVPAAAPARPGWFFIRNQQISPPLSLPQLKQLAALGQLLPSDSVWMEGRGDWVPAAAVAGLFDGAGATPVPPALPAPSPPTPFPVWTLGDALPDSKF